MFSIGLGMLTNTTINSAPPSYGNPVTGYRSTASTGINNSFVVANGYRAYFQSDSVERNTDNTDHYTRTLDNRYTTFYSNNEKILQDHNDPNFTLLLDETQNAYLINEEYIISADVNNVAKGVTSHDSKTENDTDYSTLYDSTNLKYGWGFETEISNSNITHMTVSDFHFRNSGYPGTTPSQIVLWGKENINDAWIQISYISTTEYDEWWRSNTIGTIDKSNKKSVFTKPSSDTTTKFKYFKIFMSASTFTSDSYGTHMTDFWMEGEGYKYQ